jgi:hypothetical protein
MHLFKTFVPVMALAAGACFAQQPQVLPQPIPYGSRVDSVSRSERIQKTNYQLELLIQRGGKTGRYLMTFNGGQVNTDLTDKVTEAKDGIEPPMIKFTASLIPFEDGKGGEVSVFIGRSIPYKTRAPVQSGAAGSGTEREVIQLKSVGLTTKVALSSGKAVVLFDDEDEKISLKLTSL